MVIEQFLDTFLTESEDLMRDIEAQLLKLESEPGDQEAVNALFRAVHTLKGSSGMVGIVNIEQFLHWLENVMEKVRSGSLAFNEELTDLFLRSYDHLGILIEGISGGEPDRHIDDPALKSQEEILIYQLQGYLSGEHTSSENSPVEPGATSEEDESADPAITQWKISIKFGENTFRFGFDPSSFIIHLAQIGKIIDLKTDIDRIPSVNKMDPESCYLTVKLDFFSQFEKKDIEDVFEFLVDDVELSIVPSQPKVTAYVESLKQISDDDIDAIEGKHKLGEMLVGSGAVTEKELNSALKHQQKEAGDEAVPKLGNILVETGVVDSRVLQTALEVQKPLKEKREKVSKTIRIETSKLDQFIDLVGELVISSAGIMQQSDKSKNSELIEIAAMNSRLVGEIREQIMELRMVAVQETFNRFQRVIREFNKESGKKIKLEIEGGDAELDKTVIEKLFDPLMHLVRNAADHGIESGEQRTAAGKPLEGKILLKAYHDAGSVVIEITDDGGGINRQKLLEKARSKGIISDDQHLTDKEILHLIFAPGLSTAKEVTKISGRGVGMDVVKSNIESLRGSIDLESNEGLGTTVRVNLPLTMAIIEGLLVGVGNSKYVIPLETVVECIDLPEEAKNGTHHHVNLRGKPLPFVWLRELFEEKGPESQEQSIVVIKMGDKTAGLVTDVLYGEIQAVMKNLDAVFKGVPGISGATILGDGRVCLILDINSLIDFTEQESMRRVAEISNQPAHSTESLADL